MTAEEAYDFLVSAGYKEAAAVVLGTRFVLGQWVPLSKLVNSHILKTPEKALKVIGEGTCWVTAMRAAAHWQEFVAWKAKQSMPAEAVSSVRQKTVTP